VAQKAQVVLHTDIGVSECLNRIRESIDEERRTIFSFSGYAGSKKILGKIDGNKIRLQKRRYYHNSFSPYFYAMVSPDSHGTRIEGHFDCLPFVKIFMRIWLGIVVVVAGITLVLTLKDHLGGRAHLAGEDYTVVLVPQGMVLFGLLLPRFGRWLGRNEESYILDFLQRTLPARMEIRP
jgi:hypothetical protein